MGGSERLRGLDAMRALVVGGLIFFHSVLARPRGARSSTGPTRRSGALAGWAGEAVLPDYVLHQPVLVATAYYVVRWNLHPLAKYALITTGTLLIVATIYLLLVRPIQPARLAFGLRPTPAPTAPPADSHQPAH